MVTNQQYLLDIDNVTPLICEQLNVYNLMSIDES